MCSFKLFEYYHTFCILIILISCKDTKQSHILIRYSKKLYILGCFYNVICYYLCSVNNGRIIYMLLYQNFVINWFHIKKMRAAWKKGVDWFPTLDPTWQDVIGGAITTLQQTACQCDTYSYGNLEYSSFHTYYEGDDCSDYESGSGSSSGWTECSPYYSLTTTYKPNDGFILAESAANGPGNTYPVQFMDGSGHFQMKNDSNTADAMNKIFIQGLGKGPEGYFYTPKR